MAGPVKLIRTGALIACVLAVVVTASAQVASPQPGRVQAPATPIPSMSSDLIPLLAQLQPAVQNTNLDIAKLRIEKWKTDSNVKQQAQQNADSIARNITSALPGMVDQVRANPQSLAAAFKLYRNVGALYDVLSGLAESAGAFGSKTEYDALARDVGQIDNIRRAMGDKLAEMAAFKDNEIVRLRAQAAQAAAPPSPPKRIVVDDEEKPKKPAKKKKPATTAKPATGTASKPAGSDTGTKPQ
jgi:hypothetical protein